MIYGAQGVGAFLSLGLGFTVGITTEWNHRRRETRIDVRPENIALNKVFLYGLVAGLAGAFSEPKVFLLMKDKYAATFVTVCYAIGNMLIALVAFRSLFLGVPVRVIGVVNKRVVALCLVFLMSGWSAATVYCYYLAKGLNDVYFVNKWFLVDFISACGFFMSLAVWWFIVNRLLRKARLIVEHR